MSVGRNRDIGSAAERPVGFGLATNVDSQEFLASGRILENRRGRCVYRPDVSGCVNADAMRQLELPPSPGLHYSAVGVENKHRVGLIASLKLVDQAITTDRNRRYQA